MIQPLRTRVTAAEYYRLPEYAQHELIQLIDGEVIVSMPPTPRHQAVVGEIMFLLMTIARKVGGRAFVSPVEVYLDAHNIYEPDVLYLRPGSACTVGEKRLTGAPDLVVEVLSPGTAKYDRQQKYLAYETHGVGEYWIVDPLHETVEVWTLNADGLLRRQGAFAGTDEFESAVLGETVPVQRFFTTVAGGE